MRMALVKWFATEISWSRSESIEIFSLPVGQQTGHPWPLLMTQVQVAIIFICQDHLDQEGFVSTRKANKSS